MFDPSIYSQCKQIETYETVWLAWTARLDYVCFVHSVWARFYFLLLNKGHIYSLLLADL